MMNIYRELIGLLPDDPLLIGEVLSNHADGTLTLEMPGGGRLRVRGVAAAGDRVFVRAGVVEGEAPALALVQIEV
jgi:hypothetical protein